MSRLYICLLTVVYLSGTLHARSSWLWRRDDLSGFPQVLPPAEDNTYPIEVEPVKEGGQSVEDDQSMEQDEERINNELEGYHCNPLESLLEDFVKSPAPNIAIKYMIKVGPVPPFKSTDDIYDKIKENVGIDLRTHDDRHNVACQLYAIDSINDLAALAGAPVELVALYYQELQQKFNEMGGINTLETILNVSKEFDKWAVDSGFPTVPLKSGNGYATIHDLMTKWQTALLSMKAPKKLIMNVVNNNFAPFKFAPDFTALVLTENTDTNLVIQSLCIARLTYDAAMEVLTAKNVEEIDKFMTTVIKILHELDRMGLFTLQMEQ